MSFLKKLFGGGSSGDAGPAKPKRQIEYNGFTIAADVRREFPECDRHQRNLPMWHHRFTRMEGENTE